MAECKLNSGMKTYVVQARACFDRLELWARLSRIEGREAAQQGGYRKGASTAKARQFRAGFGWSGCGGLRLGRCLGAAG